MVNDGATQGRWTVSRRGPYYLTADDRLEFRDWTTGRLTTLPVLLPTRRKLDDWESGRSVPSSLHGDVNVHAHFVSPDIRCAIYIDPRSLMANENSRWKSEIVFNCPG
ncbi:MAG: hypothetical protein ACJ746_10755 [Bryobacteraceae bacterium]